MKKILVTIERTYSYLKPGVSNTHKYKIIGINGSSSQATQSNSFRLRVFTSSYCYFYIIKID